MSAMASQTTSVSIICSTVCSKLRVTGRCEGIHWWPADSAQKGPVTRKMFPFDDVIIFMKQGELSCIRIHWVPFHTHITVSYFVIIILYYSKCFRNMLHSLIWADAYGTVRCVTSCPICAIITESTLHEFVWRLKKCMECHQSNMLSDL